MRLRRTRRWMKGVSACHPPPVLPPSPGTLPPRGEERGSQRRRRVVRARVEAADRVPPPWVGVRVGMGGGQEGGGTDERRLAHRLSPLWAPGRRLSKINYDCLRF